MQKLPFGYNAGLPEGVEGAWGCRLIVRQDGYTDFLHDRQGGFAEDGYDKAPLYEWLKTAVDGAREKASELLRSYKMSTREEKHFVLYSDRKGMVVGNTNGSAGYLYLAAWLYDAEPESVRPDGPETAEGGLIGQMPY